MMKVDQFCNTANDIATKYRTQYKLGGIGEHNGDLWYFDCVGLIKSIIWGWCGDLNYSRGGAVYASNGLPDVGANQLFSDYCYDKSTDFNNIQRGELVWLDGHIGIYIGNRKVAEATSAWDNKVLISDIGNKGQRTYNGRQVYSWTHHGKFNLLEYTTPTYKYSKGTNVVLNGWLHKTKDKDSECLGEFHDYLWTITDTQDGEYPYQLNKIGWCRETYLTPYQDKNEYEQLYKKEMLVSKDLVKQLDQYKSQSGDLENQVKSLTNKINKIKEIIK